MSTLQPRKAPQQKRSKVTVEAILDACDDVLTRRGYAALSTHAIATRAGVSIGTLYQYFPNRDAVASALVIRAMERLLESMRRALAECIQRRLGSLEGTEHLLLTGLEVLVANKHVFVTLGSEAMHLFRLPAVAEIQGQLIQLSQEIRLTSGDRLDLPMPEADAWLIGHMVSASMVQISRLDVPGEQQRVLTREVARLICRMALEGPTSRGGQT